MTFENLLEELNKGKTFHDVCNEQNNNMVERFENTVYYDDDLNEFLKQLGAEIEDFGVGYAIINTVDGKVYEVPYEERENRFDITVGNEIVLFFDEKRIYDVTENYKE